MDELECFRKAAELGCPDFRFNLVNSEVCFESDSDHHVVLPAIVGPLPWNMDVKRINRYAAAVCADWWRDHADGLPMFDQAKQDFCIRMINAARAFGKKYGEA